MPYETNVFFDKNSQENSKRKEFSSYAETRNQCETKLAEMIAEKKVKIAEEN